MHRTECSSQRGRMHSTECSSQRWRIHSTECSSQRNRAMSKFQIAIGTQVGPRLIMTSKPAAVEPTPR